MPFPNHFTWGAAAASYQIEGSTDGVDGCGRSVWDMVGKRKGFIKGGDTGAIACDHYRRYPEDIALMREIGLQAYRLSISWPRILPEGRGKTNAAGLDFYGRLIDGLLAAGITPWVTLFHWDYPVALFQQGGWLNRDAPHWFAEYTQVVVDALSDRVRHWFTLNEPACFIGLGHDVGIQAPGITLPGDQVNRAWHHSLLAHGRAVQVIRDHSRHELPPVIGAAPVFATAIPASEAPADIQAAREHLFSVKKRDMWQATWGLDPLFTGAYPEDGLRLWGADAPDIQPGDMELIHQPLDFMGFNLYHSPLVRAGQDGRPEQVPYGNDHPHGDLQWPVTPDALRWASTFMYERYGKPIVITENGAPLTDWVAIDGKVHDHGRIDYMHRYLIGLEQAIDAGVDVMGYFYWSIMDNFEWSEGYRRRFGLIHVDYETQKRTIKESGHWYRQVIDSNGAMLNQSAMLDPMLFT